MILSIAHPFSRQIEDEREVAQRFAPVRGDGGHAEQVQGQDLPGKHEVLRVQESAHEHEEQARRPGYYGTRSTDKGSFAGLYLSVFDQKDRTLQAQEGWHRRQEHGVGRLMKNQAHREGKSDASCHPEGRQNVAR